jgi:ribosomal protein S16
MRKIRVYQGCELNSPIYRQIVAENSRKDKISKGYNPKRGKYKPISIITDN